MKKLAFCFLASFSGLAQASGAVDFLQVDDDVVMFSTDEAKVVPSPACVTAENQNLWSVSLATDAGRAIYSMVLTSMAKGSGLGLSVESANDCGVTDGVERAKKVALDTVISAENASNSSAVGLYKNDGVTRVGGVLKFTSNNDFFYATEEAAFAIRQVSYYRGVSIYYEQDNCAGEAFTERSEAHQFNAFHNDGKFFTMADAAAQRNLLSYKATDGVCRAYTATKYTHSIGQAEAHPLCGLGPCLFKVD